MWSILGTAGSVGEDYSILTDELLSSGSVTDTSHLSISSCFKFLSTVLSLRTQTNLGLFSIAPLSLESELSVHQR